MEKTEQNPISKVVTPVESPYVRGSKRFEVSIRALLGVAPASAGVVRWTGTVGARNGLIECDAVDISEGGIGLVSMVFLPRNAMVSLRLLAPTSQQETIFESLGQVRRVTMIDRRPAYQIGLSFERLTAQSKADFELLLARLSGESSSLGGSLNA